ncbi:hypothetical protein EST38_g638 [Candolleomyces aberdarensis]|uniref:Uncharacterized protein n=1 Tax=Candolleomyces aberdarensis TaxID=2316362 RepID=A0A4V1Q5E1_9AGAR|nr:hypothetical protein EST38_g638 [Candolleomyces aberdarensis]
MSTPSSPAGDASNIVSEPVNHPDEHKKKKKKRSREDDPDSQEVTGEKKKKKKRHSDGGEGKKDSAEKKKKKKKGKKDKHQEKEKEREEVAVEDDDSDIDANAQASTAALLNAIVAAVSSAAPPEAEEPPAPTHLPPPPPPHFITHPHPAFLPFSLGQLPPGFVPPPGAFPPGVPGELYGSNDDVIRALQTMDVTKIAGVMKTLGDAAAAANVPLFPFPHPLIPIPLPPPSSAVGQVPVGSTTILNTGVRHLAAPIASNPDRVNGHAELLATKWLNARKLAELVETEGLVYKKGKFSAIEEKQLKDAIDKYKQGKDLDDGQLHELIFPGNEKNKDNDFWTEITRAVPQRPIIAVYHHVRRTHHPDKLKGSWKADEDARLKQAVADLGQQWEKVSLRVGRMSSDCRDRYRNHIVGSEVRVSGAWSKEEEEELTRIVTDMTIKQGRDIDNDVFWSRVSQLMGGRRGRQQCRIKWTDSLSKLVKNDGEKPRWNHTDAYILVHKVDSLNVNDDTEIDWKTLPDHDWNLWSAHTLQRRWLTMKRSVKGHEEMSHQEIMDILRVKKSHLPAMSSPSRRSGKKSRKITSATTVSDEAALNGGQPEASGSGGSGNLNGASDGEESGDDSD